MSNEIREIDNTASEATNPYTGNITIDVRTFNYLIGKVFTHAELLGLPERQYAVYKSTLRAMFWDWYNSHLDNPQGYSDPSHQARVEAGIESVISSTSASPVTYTTN